MLVYGRGTIQDHPQISSPKLYDYGLSFAGVEPSFNIPPKRGVDGVCYAQYVLTTWMMVTQVVVSHTFSIWDGDQNFETCFVGLKHFETHLQWFALV